MQLEPYLLLSGTEIANSIRTMSYLRQGLGGKEWSVRTCPTVAEGTGYVDAYCLAPEHRLLTADLRWVPCGDIEAGDELLAFEEHPQPGKRLRQWRWSEVTRSQPAMKDCVRVHLSNGDTIVCSWDHPWLAKRSLGSKTSGMRWVGASKLTTDHIVQRVSDTWEPASSFDDGWLSGMFDGEGCLCITTPDKGTPTIRLQLAQKPGPVLDRAVALLQAHKFQTTTLKSETSSADQVTVRGGQSEVLRALGILRPTRLLNTLRSSEICNRTVRSPDGPGVRVLAVEPWGRREIRSIATSTGTYVGEGYLMHNTDIYGPDRYEVANLCCFCETQHVDGNYGDPAYDMAPWYDAARPESADFFGLIPDITLMPVAQRNVTRRSAGRGDVGPLIVGPRIIQVEGAIYAGSKAGMGYGERWLSKVLSGTCGPGCSGDTLTVLPYCTAHDGDDGTGSLRELVPVGIVDGPIFSAPVVRAVCQYQEVKFQFAAGEGWLRKTTNLYSGALMNVCETLTPSLVGDAAAVIAIEAIGDLSGVTISGGGFPCTIEDLGAGDTLVIDASKHTVTVTNGVGTVVGGLNVLDFDGMFQWFETCDGMTVCVNALGATGSGTLTISQVDLEL